MGQACAFDGFGWHDFEVMMGFRFAVINRSSEGKRLARLGRKATMGLPTEVAGLPNRVGCDGGQ